MRMQILPMLLSMALSACGLSKPEILPPPAPVQTEVVFAPIDGALLSCLDGPDLAAAIGQVEAIKYDTAVPPIKRASLIIGVQGTLLYRFQHALLDCKAKLAEIARAQKQP
jgi:hypothetical protein